MKKTLAIILAILMLASVVVSVSAADEATDWKAITHSLGLNIYVGAAMETSPVVDGTIGEGEYSFTREIPREEIINYSAEIQSGFTEYMAHDADYIYYAVVFEQYANNRALQWQIRPFNTFDIFHSKGDESNEALTKTLWQRITWQLRYQDDGTTTVHENPAWNYSITTRLPVVGAGEDIEYAATKTTEGDIKTYELKLAKAYIAEISDCEVEDVNVLPYMTYVHSGPAIAHSYTAEDVAVLTEAGATRADVATGFLFMVLEEDPAKTTVATTTEAPATTTVAEATTTAAATTTAKAADATTTTADAEEKGGCGSSLAISALVMIPTLAGGVVLTSKKRRED